MTKPVRKSAPNRKVLNKAKRPTDGAAGKRKTKASSVISMLERRNGTTLAELAASTGWQDHSVRGFLSGTVKKKLGREIVTRIVDGERRYSIEGKGAAS